jgi:hypothetical protein
MSTTKLAAMKRSPVAQPTNQSQPDNDDQRPRYIAYFDLLGTSDLSRYEPLTYITSLGEFKTHVTSEAKYLTDGSVHYFSDCAFVECNDLAELISYMQRVRGSLFDGGYYLTAAIAPGALKPKHKSSGRVAGTYFEGDVVEVYGLQSNLKGIGVRVHPKLVDSVRDLRQAVDTCHLPLTTGRQGECFVDLKYDVVPRHEPFRLFLRNFFKVNTRSRRLGRYYISALISWINSSRFDTVELPTEEGDNRSLVLDVLLNGTFERNFGDLVGIEYIYFALLDKIFRDDTTAELREFAQKYVAQRRTKLVARVEHVPPCIFSRESYGKFVDFLSSRTGFLPPRRVRRAVSRA